MLDIAVAYNRYGFLGNEFLTWLWFLIENDQSKLSASDQDFVSLEIGNRIVFENRLNDNSLETITIKGDDAGLEEGLLALKKGSVVTELNLSFKAGDQEWRFNIKGESMNISGLKSPETATVEKKEDIEGAVLEKAFLYQKAIDLIDNLFKQFIKTRISDEWKNEVIPHIKKWISS